MSQLTPIPTPASTSAASGHAHARGSSPKTAAARELEEETGYASNDLELLLSIRTTVAFCDEEIDIYVAKNLVKTHQHLDEDEYLNVK